TRFTRTRLSDIVHPVSSSQLTQDPDRVRSFGGYNKFCRLRPAHNHRSNQHGQSINPTRLSLSFPQSATVKIDKLTNSNSSCRVRAIWKLIEFPLTCGPHSCNAKSMRWNEIGTGVSHGCRIERGSSRISHEEAAAGCADHLRSSTQENARGAASTYLARLLQPHARHHPFQEPSVARRALSA